MNRPSSPLVVWRATPVATLRTTMVTPGRAPPVTSVTVPARVAPVWARTGAAAERRTRTAASTVFVDRNTNFIKKVYWLRHMLDSTDTTPATGTEVGSYFVANYPPFSVWTPEAVRTD